MYEYHPLLETPKSEQAIWRYIDIPKLIDILVTKELFFCRLDKFEDPFEGVFPPESYEVMYKNLIDNRVPSDAIDEEFKQRLQKGLDDFRERNVVSCWHINDEESDAMWKIYSNKGIAIKTTFKRLCNSFVHEKEKSINIGKVRYSNDLSNPPFMGWVGNASFLKRKCYEHEKELRAIITDDNIFESGYYRAKVDPDILIEKVFISPIGPKWFKVPLDMLVEKYEYNTEVILSKILDLPEYILRMRS